MIGTLRKHQTWLWSVIIAAVIVSFVIYFTPSVSRDRGGVSRGQFGSMHGRPLTRKQFFEAYTESQLAQFLRTGTWPDAGDARRTGVDLDRMARERIVLIDRLEALEVEVNDASVAAWVEQNFAHPNQPGSARLMYEALVKQLDRYDVTEGDLVRYIRHEIGISHLVALAGVAGELVTPREAELHYRRQNERLEAEAVVFSSSNYLASVNLDPEAVAQFYTNRLAAYRIPEKVQVQYVQFDFTNFLSQAEATLSRRTNLTAELDALYAQAGANRFLDTNGQVMPPDAAKARIRDDLLQNESRLAARRAAAVFGNELDKMQPVQAENLATLAAQKELAVTTLAPFSEMEGPRELNVRATFARAAFALNPQEPISPPVVGEDAVYLLALKGRVPSEVPSLDAVRDRVTEEFRREQARLLAREAGTNFVTSLTNALAAGQSFGDACAAANVTPIPLPKFSASSRNLPDWDRRVNFEQVRATSASLQAGTASNLLLTADGAMLVYLRTREPVTDAELKDALPTFLADLRQERQFEGFSDWFRHQILETRIDMPSEEEQNF